MTRARQALVALALAGSLGCGAGSAAKGSPKVGKTPPTDAPASGAQVSLATGVLPGSERVLRIDLAAARSTPLFLPLVGLTRLEPLAAPLARAEKLCGFAPIHAIEGAVLSQGVDGWLAVLRPALGEDEALACVAKVTDSAVVRREGRGWVETPLFTATAADGNLILGNDAAVTVFFAAPPTSEERRAPALGDGEIARGEGAIPGDATRVEARVAYRSPARGSRGNEHLELRLSADVHDAQAAGALYDRLTALRERSRDGAKNPRARAFLESFRFTHPGTRVVVEAGADGDRKAIVDYLDLLVGLGEDLAGGGR